MPEEESDILDSQPAAREPLRWPPPANSRSPLPPPPPALSPPVHFDDAVRRFVDFLAGVFFPALLLLFASASGVFVPEWQTGNTLDFGLMILNSTSLSAFAPLLVYSAISLVCVITDPERFAPSRFVRFGVYSGLLTIGPIAVLIGLRILSDATGTPGDSLVALLGMLNVVCFVWLLAGPLRKPWGQGLLALAIFVFFVELFATDAFGHGSSGEVTLLLQIFALICSLPWVSMAVFARYAWGLHSAYGRVWQFRLLDLLGITAWCAYYMNGWRAAYATALETYSRLPASPPTCYIATAAARGHRRIVGASELVSSEGVPWIVNRQLACLKAAELALLVTAPGLHRATRAVYDRLGPPLARRINNPWLADVAYLSLKPAEWGAMWLLRRAMPEIDSRAERLFGVESA
ncbi:MAG: hypothetical protein K2Y37_23765 [Pirellulales bacterium]|nr:hypothetical protein [Pirellulales bacterium]